MKAQLFQIATAALVLSAQAAPDATFPTRPNANSALVCDEPVYDFGTLDSEETVKHVFVLRNTGRTAVEIEKIFACCGSTAEVSTTTIRPGQDATLRIKQPLKGRSGSQIMSFYLRLNASTCPIYELRMTGTALARVDIQPSGLMLGGVPGHGEIAKIVTIACQSNIVFHVTNLVSSSEYVIATYLGASGNVHRVSVGILPSLPLGITRAIVRVLTDDRKYQELEIPVTARMTKDIVVFPGEIRMVRSEGSKGQGSWYAVVRSLSKTPFKITGSESPVPGAEFVYSPMASGGYKMEIRNLLPDEELDGKQVIIRTDSKDAREVAIPIRVLGP